MEKESSSPKWQAEAMIIYNRPSWGLTGTLWTDVTKKITTSEFWRVVNLNRRLYGYKLTKEVKKAEGGIQEIKFSMVTGTDYFNSYRYPSEIYCLRLRRLLP